MSHLSGRKTGVGVTMSLEETNAICWFSQKPADEDVAWEAPSPVDPMINYYIWPRKIWVKGSGKKAAWQVDFFATQRVEIRRCKNEADVSGR